MPDVPGRFPDATKGRAVGGRLISMSDFSRDSRFSVGKRKYLAPNAAQVDSDQLRASGAGPTVL